MKKDQEKWKWIKGHEGLYQVSNRGRIKSFQGNGRGTFQKGEILKTSTTDRGYPIVSLTKNHITKVKKIHRLVLNAFILKSKNKIECNHKNGIKTDNRIENLEWCTREENMQHAHKMKLMNMPKGEECHLTKLNRFQVQRIRLMCEIMPKLPQRVIGKIFNTDQTNISLILNRRNWKHI